MNILTKTYNSAKLRYLEVANTIVFNTKDLCEVLGLNYQERVKIHPVLNQTCCDLQTAFEITMSNQDFYGFLTREFEGVETTQGTINITDLDENWNIA